LLDNAIKYTSEKGKITVSVVLQDHEVIIKIEDTGIGIDSDDFEKIFERFYRADASRTKQGTGLGLSLARTIVRQHKGDISVSKKHDRGSVFTITLPYNNLEVI